MPVTIRRGPLTNISTRGVGALNAKKVGTKTTGTAVKPIDPGAGFVAFTSQSPPQQLVCRLGGTSATLTGGVGGWGDAERPGRDDGIEWGSTPGEKLSIPVLFDGLLGRESVESFYKTLRSLGKPPPGAKRGTTPPILKVTGMVPHGGREWVITDIAEGDALWSGRHRTRLFVTVELAAYEPPALVVLGSEKPGAAGGSSSGAARKYTVKRGDTLASIARKELGANSASAIAKAVAAIKKANGIRDAKSIKPGQKIKLPRYEDTVKVSPFRLVP